LVIVRLSDVQPERINWLWRNRIPRDKVSVLGGMAGLGKTFATLDMASRVSTGEPWPDLPDDPIEVGSVVILNLEDGLGDTIRPRLDAMGANLDKIVAVEGVYEIDKQGRRMFNITQDVHHLELVIEQLGDARLVILDPLTAYIGSKLDSWRDNEVRAVLYPLGELAKRCKVAVVGVMHVRKSPSDKAMFRVLGSVAFTAYARAVWLIGEDRDSDDPDCRLLLPVKLNIARAAPGLRFRITDRGVVEWLGDTDTTADEAFAPADPEDAGPKVKSAIEWLKGVLADGAQAAMAIKAQARENCIAARTLDRAKSRLKVVASNEGVFGQAWYWSLPESKP
ncbi:MAG: AAA family ATPase, partial [Planctomycetes bacterium]|nr:AAA family ATPase [Planctomycetota bacterium]